MANGTKGDNGKFLESWIWDAACSIRGAKDAPKYKEFILQENISIEGAAIRPLFVCDQKGQYGTDCCGGYEQIEREKV